VSLGTLIWLSSCRPRLSRLCAAALWTGPGAAPFYRVRVSPGERGYNAMLINSSRLRSLGCKTGLRIHVRYQSASKWEEVTMLPQPAADAPSFCSLEIRRT